MAEKQTATITINDKDYSLEDLSNDQKTLIAHIQDLDRKIRSAQFNLDQLNVGRDAFANALNNSLAESESEG
jgi:peptidoglycan hydrolase CwlO-like protein